MKILFVCTGNICRSPLGEGITRHLAAREGLEIVTASAGTHGYHVGEPPDSRSIQVARDRGVSLKGQKARAVASKDFTDFDLILAMDAGHLEWLQAKAPAETTARLALFLEYTQGRVADVPDPYYGDIRDFEAVYDMVEAGVAAMLKRL